MLSLCLLSLDDLPRRQTAWDRLIVSLPFGQAEQERLRSIRNKTAFLQSLGGQLALQALTERRKFTNSLLLSRTALGKPFFTNQELPAFSISHSDSLATAILGDRHSGAVGLDLEFVRTTINTERIAQRFFQEEASKALAETQNQSDAFYLLWTKKEALAKLSGQGLSACLGATSPSAAHTKSFRVVYGDRIAYLTVACDSPIEAIDIYHYNKKKEPILYELPN